MLSKDWNPHITLSCGFLENQTANLQNTTLQLIFRTQNEQNEQKEKKVCQIKSLKQAKLCVCLIIWNNLFGYHQSSDKSNI